MLVHGRKPDDFFKDVRRDAPGAIIDVHHPRIDAEIGYFDLGQFDARNDKAGRAGFSWDFDALEVMNGYQDPVRRSADRVVDDWFALLNHDHLVTATGNEVIYQGFSLLTANRDVLARPEMARIAARVQRTVSQVVFRFALAVGMLPLTGTTDAEHMRQDLEALDFELEPNEIEQIERLGIS